MSRRVFAMSALFWATSILPAASVALEITCPFRAAWPICCSGFPSRYQQDSNTVFNLFQKIYSLYAQDDWKVSTRLTLNYGLRYEFSTPPRERDFQWANFDPSTRAYIQAKEGSLFSESLIHPDYNNFAPRFGFAYAPTSRTVVRGAYGVFYNHTNRQGREGLLGFNYPFIILRDQQIAGSWDLEDERRHLPTARRHSGRVHGSIEGQPGHDGSQRVRTRTSVQLTFSNGTSAFSRNWFRTCCSTSLM